MVFNSDERTVRTRLMKSSNANFDVHRLRWKGKDIQLCEKIQKKVHMVQWMGVYADMMPVDDACRLFPSRQSHESRQS